MGYKANPKRSSMAMNRRSTRDDFDETVFPSFALDGIKIVNNYT